MGSWTHAICDNCWNEQNPDTVPVRLRAEYMTEEVCCFCGTKTRNGIFIRHDPGSLRCKGVHNQ